MLPGADAWTAVLDAAPSAPATADAEGIYVPLANGEIAAYARESGERIWTATIASRWPVVPAGDVLLIADGDKLVELDRMTGAIRRQATLPGSLTAPMSRGDRYLIASVEPNLIIRWDLGEWREEWRHTLRDRSTSAPLVTVSGVVVLAGDTVTMLRASDGRLSWTTRLDGTLFAPVAAGERIFLASTTDTLYALDARRGELDWHDPGGSDIVGITADREHVYVAGLDHVVRAFDQRSGNQPWRRVIETRIVSAPKITGEHLLVGGLRPALTLVATHDGAVHGTHALPELSALRQDLLLEPVRRASASPGATDKGDTSDTSGASEASKTESPDGPAPVGIVVITRDNEMIGIRPQPPAEPKEPSGDTPGAPGTPGAPDAPGANPPPQVPDASGVSARASRRMPSSMRSADGSENDNRIVS